MRKSAVLGLSTVLLAVALPAAADTITSDNGDSTVSLSIPAVPAATTAPSTVTIAPVTPVPATTTPATTPAPVTPTRATVSAPRPTPTIDVVTVMGSGCPADTAAVSLSSGDTSVSITFSEFVARITADGLASQSRQNCQIALSVDTPEGYTYALRQIDLKTTASLAADAQAVSEVSTYFQGDAATGRTSKTLDGRYQGTWRVRHTVADADLIWKSCGADVNLNINISARVTADSDRTASSLAVTKLYNPQLAWARC
jgi:hypothetical protein